METRSSSENHQKFTPGMRIRILEGPYKDFRGEIKTVIQSQERVRVAVNFFSREVVAEFSFTQIARERDQA